MPRLLPLIVLLAACSKESEPAPEEEAPPHPRPQALVFETPPEWKAQKPESTMRKAQYALPDRDKTEGEATLIYFGTLGGGVEGNINRWKEQFSHVQGEPKVETLKAGDFDVTLLDIAGTYDSGTGAPPAAGTRMLAAVVRTPRGDHFFKLLGPPGTVDDWRDAFVGMLKTCRPK